MDQRSKIAILGYGAEGRAIYNYLYDKGYHELTVCDQDVDLKAKLGDGVSAHLGESYLHDLDQFDVVFRSPGVKYLEPGIQAAIAKGVDVTSSTAYFLDQRPCKVVGVTGTKGKGTTCTLIHEMLKASGMDSHVAGNIGDPAISLLNITDADSVVVLELSSFQLQDMKASPDFAVLLNTTEDHLDYHADKDEYMRAKEALLAHQKSEDVAVLNKDYEYVKFYEPVVKGMTKFVSVKEELKEGAYVENDEIYYSEKGKKEKVCKVSDVALIGSHNLENIMPSIVIAKTMGVDMKHIKKVIKGFEGLPNRLEFVKEVKKIKFYNDSFSTGPITSMAAVDSFEDPTILIAGGYDKGLNYNEWALKILTKPSLKIVILMGDTASIMEDAIVEADEKLGEAEGSPTQVLRRQNLEESVLTAFAEAEEGGVVVMSPAAASFDQFENYKERGKAFVGYVKKLK
ncbi:UDP-N-acetylmuramoyl-L-alanine--D-glutamate ligase [Candidatus Peregrinibacteria bacterium]|jgi:UDP-N-acetylmuramoylalanine--D-glutamate ligase|nr:UDP-N-acetylmuramoyl-L-alanine--D-glutamate ligase [Candidatus Peregrinibacteria bacterium]MBT7736376.1 UDP-N-acetylmuramoyl-L-alanine--D-glutamate ligase [Candidatus Peregrinibacteria bacterium]